MAIPGEILVKETSTGEVEANLQLNRGLIKKEINVENTGDRPIQTGSHFHLYEVNAALKFNREKANGYRFNIPP